MNAMCLNHPQTISPNSVRGKVVFHETSNWCQKDWGPPSWCSSLLIDKFHHLRRKQSVKASQKGCRELAFWLQLWLVAPPRSWKQCLCGELLESLWVLTKQTGHFLRWKAQVFFTKYHENGTEHLSWPLGQAFLHWKALQSESVDEMGIKKKKGEIKGFSKNNKMYQYPNMRWFINKNLSVSRIQLLTFMQSTQPAVIINLYITKFH